MSERNFEILRNLISEEFGIPQTKITFGAKLKGDLGIDSIDLMQMATIIEERYTVNIPQELMEKQEALTVGAVVECLDALGIS